jgi:predicted nucleic acid-binding protein
MNQAIVVDASVAVKWLLDEDLTDRARALLVSAHRARLPVLAPPHLPSEVTNTIHQRFRRKDITETEAEEALAKFLGLPVRLLGPVDLYRRALAFAREHRLGDTYDSLYVVLAEILDSELWTDDRALLKAVRSVAPWVRWIGDYAPPE